MKSFFFLLFFIFLTVCHFVYATTKTLNEVTPVAFSLISYQSSRKATDIIVKIPTQKTVSTAYYKLGKNKKIEFAYRIDTVFKIINNQKLITSISQTEGAKTSLIEENIYNTQGQITQRYIYKKGVWDFEEEYTYNKKQNLIKTIIRVGGNIEQQIDRVYDQLDLCNEEIYKNEFGQQIKHKQLSYYPDKKRKEEIVYAGLNDKVILEQKQWNYEKNKLKQKLYLGKRAQIQKEELYDKNEMLTDIITYGIHDREIEKIKFVYDEKYVTTLVEKITMGGNEKIIETVQTTLDNAIGRPIQVVVLDKNKIVLSQISFGYNKKNELIKEEHIKAGVIDYIKVYNRNAQGIVTEEILYNAQQQVIEKKIFSFSFAS